MTSFTQGPAVSVTVAAGQNVTLTLPARNAGDLLQFVVHAPEGARADTFTTALEVNGLYLFQKVAAQTAAAGGTFNLKSIGAGTVTAVAQAISTADSTTQPTTPTDPTPPVDANPLKLKAFTAGASVTGAASGEFNTFAGARVHGTYATWGSNGHWNQQESDGNGGTIQGGKVWALVLGSGSEYGSGKLSSLGRFDLDIAPQFGIRKGDGSGGSWQAASTDQNMKTWLVNHLTEVKNNWWGDATQQARYRPCHEMNGNWYSRWTVRPEDVTWFVKWWQEILYPAWDQVMSSDPRFLLEWCPNRDSSYNYDVRTLYPGADYVDVHGVDYYDFPFKGTPLAITDAAWTAEITSTQNGGPKGIQAHLDFAAAQGKALTVPEMGQQWNDRPDFLTRLGGWAVANRYTGSGSPAGKVLDLAYHNLLGGSPDPNAGGDFLIQKAGGIYSRAYGSEMTRPNASQAWRTWLQSAPLRTV